MEDSSRANGSSPVSADTRTHIARPLLPPSCACQLVRHNIQQRFFSEVHLPHYAFSSLLLPLTLLKILRQRAHAYRAHISISARLHPTHLFACVCTYVVSYAAFSFCIRVQSCVWHDYMNYVSEGGGGEELTGSLRMCSVTIQMRLRKSLSAGERRTHLAT